MSLATDELDETGVMAFTALPRDKWGEVRGICLPGHLSLHDFPCPNDQIREQLEQDRLNKETLQMIDSSYIILSLEAEPVNVVS